MVWSILISLNLEIIFQLRKQEVAQNWKSVEYRVWYFCTILCFIKNYWTSWAECITLQPTHGVIYWPSTEQSIKRCTCVNKRRNSGSRWALNNNITRCQTVRVSWRKDAEVASCRLRTLQPSVTHGWATQAGMGMKHCYGQRRTWVNIAVCPLSPAHLLHTTFKNKVWEIYFYKEVCSFFIEVVIMFDYVSVYMYMWLWLWVYNNGPDYVWRFIMHHITETFLFFK